MQTVAVAGHKNARIHVCVCVCVFGVVWILKYFTNCAIQWLPCGLCIVVEVLEFESNYRDPVKRHDTNKWSMLLGMACGYFAAYLEAEGFVTSLT